VLAIPYEWCVRAAADPKLLWAVVDLLSRRLRMIDSALADAVFLDVTRAHGEAPPRARRRSGRVPAPPYTQEELAGTGRRITENGLNKALASFIRLGWISQEGRRYRITNRASSPSAAR